mgnify:CR=1 FL=1
MSKLIWNSIVLTSLFFMINQLDAQWIQTSGPERGQVRCFTVIDGDIFAGTHGGVFLSITAGIFFKGP